MAWMVTPVCMCVLAGLLSLAQPLSAQTVLEDVTITVEKGPIRGERVQYGGKTLDRYLGIPYGQKPTGKLRFMPPEEPDEWTAVKDTKAFGDSCMQNDAGWKPSLTDLNEDCLSLNVYAPTDGENLPIMVWIHGGGFNTGGSSQYRPETLAVTGNVIVVSINYRVGIFGFLVTSDGAEGNAGMLDQVMALKWVQTNAKLFRGDPSHVTVFGNSAGSISINLLMASPLARGLFQRAICQSGALYDVPLDTAEDRAKVTQKMAEDTAIYDCANDILGCFQKLTVRDLMEKAVKFSYGGGFPPTVGGSFLPQAPGDYFRGQGSDPEYYVDLMTGVTSDEGLRYLIGDQTNMTEFHLTNGVSTDDPNFYMFPNHALRALKPGAAPAPEDDLWPILRDHYYQDTSDPLQNMRAALDMAGNALFLAPTLRTVQRWASTGQKVYLYYFDQVLPKMPRIFGVETDSLRNTFFFPTLNNDLPLGAPHVMDLFYTFGLISEEADTENSNYASATEGDRLIGKALVNAFVTFAKTGTPEYLLPNGTSIQWPQYDHEDQKYLEFKDPMSEDSVKERLLPSNANFLTRMLPAYFARQEAGVSPPSPGKGEGTKGTDGDSEGKGKSTEEVVEKRSVSTIDRDKAETALFILSAVVIVLLLLTVILLMNYNGLKKELKNKEKEQKATKEDFQL